MKMDQPFGIHWFRRDLRVIGNEALQLNRVKNSGRVLGLFCFDSKFLSREDFSHHRFAFFLKTLKSLKEDFRNTGGDLLVVDGQPNEALPQIIHFFKDKQKNAPSMVTFNRDYEPFARHRDQVICEHLKELCIPVETSRDHLILEPQEVLKPEGDFYKVYTPYFKKWFSEFSQPSIQKRVHFQSSFQENEIQKLLVSSEIRKDFHSSWDSFLKHPDFPYQDRCEAFEMQNQKQVTIEIPEAGVKAAVRSLLEFKKVSEKYLDSRDFPSLQGTSKLSHFFKNGTLTTSQVLKFLDLKIVLGKEKSASLQYLKEIVWREFYYSILFHRPDVEKGCFLSQYDSLKWENSGEKFEAWKEGKTGFPIVDAGMRELKTTGFMHNRVRMIVASFLTKDLLIDWRLGENHFMKTLLDGDLAPNNGGWQWAASTGCDPQPYFRVFNPWLQSEKFDEEGTYIKKFIPELRSVPAKILHDPDADRSRWLYPKPIVDHSTQRDKAIKLFKK